ncbi:MAG: gamma-glutamyltransferase, partial [Rhodospirillales bacterium]|nr:gamma-glutamyltransferase [Rhodospirillales bacterium]
GATDLEEGTPLAELKSELEALGHKVSLRPLTSGLHAVMTTPEGLVGGADPRREGVALGD